MFSLVSFEQGDTWPHPLFAQVRGKVQSVQSVSMVKTCLYVQNLYDESKLSASDTNLSHVFICTYVI